MESQVQEIKQKLDIVEVIGKYITVKKRGRHYLANCPFHGEKTPSFTISPELQIFKCFGCGKAGDVFSFVQEYEHVDFREALEDMAKIAGVVLKKDPHLTQVEKLHRRLVELNQEAAKFYHYILTTHPLGKPALDYLINRHITLETIKLFRLGYSPSNPELVSNYLLKKGFTKQEMLRSGTYGTSRYGNSTYDRFLGRVIFPQSDFRDRILGFSGRILPSDKSQNQAKYINSPETDIYHKSQLLFGLNLAREEIKKKKTVIIVEGEFDMISPYQEGIKNIVAIKGTAFTIDQLQLLHRYTETLILGLDADLAGTNAALKSIELADSMGFDIHVIDLQSRFKDPDEAISADPQFFKTQLSTPVPIWDFIINSALKANDSTTPKGKQDILRQVLPMLAKISNLVTRSDYLAKLASTIGSATEAVEAEAKKYLVSGKIATSVIASSTIPVIPKMDILEEHLLSLIFSAKKPYLLAAKISENFTFITPRYQKVFSFLLKPRKNFVAAKFASRLPPELSSVFQDIFLHSTQFEFDSHARLLEINKTINQILSITYKDQLTTLSTKIAQAENMGEEEIVKKLEQDYNHILSELSSIQSTKR
ncbi:MAG: DNA primase [Candidatus Shapirobacteria bacterium]|jgi:DNA primase